MEMPLAFKVAGTESAEVYRVQVDRAQAEAHWVRADPASPAVVITRGAGFLPELSAGMIDSADVVAAFDGDWSNAVLVVLPTCQTKNRLADREQSKGDAGFLAQVKHEAPGLAELAEHTVTAIRAAGVDGTLVQSRLGRWVNQPLNTFTLKAQPRAGNLQFTLYGNPDSYRAGSFLRKDQNSYSRGWVRGPSDATLLAELARESHSRRKG